MPPISSKSPILPISPDKTRSTNDVNYTLFSLQTPDSKKDYEDSTVIPITNNNMKRTTDITSSSWPDGSKEIDNLSTKNALSNDVFTLFTTESYDDTSNYSSSTLTGEWIPYLQSIISCILLKIGL